MTTSPTGLDPLEHAKTELAQSMIPQPDDYMGDLGPLAACWYLNQVAWATLRHYTALLAAPEGGTPEDGSDPVQALKQLSMAVGMLDQVCVTLDMLPKEAAATP